MIHSELKERRIGIFKNEEILHNNNNSEDHLRKTRTLVHTEQTIRKI